MIDEKFGFEVKNRYSERPVPIHPDISGAFWAYCEALRARGETYLFPEISMEQRAARDGPGRVISRFVNDELLPELGLKDRFTVEHSFRHGLMNRLRDAGVHSEHIDWLVGHAGNGTRKRHYSECPSVEVLYAQIAKVRFPVTPAAFKDPAMKTPE